VDRIVKFVLGISDIIDRIAGSICIFLGIGMTVIVVVSVFFRYVLLSPLVWAEEISTFLMVWLAMMGASMGLKKNKHVGVNYIVEKLVSSKRVKKIISIIVNVLIVIFLIVMLKEGYSLSLFAKNQVSPAIGISMFWPYFGLLVGGFIMIVQVVCRIIEDFNMVVQRKTI